LRRRRGVAQNRHSLYNRAMRGIPFVKMHGLGNDFVVLDARAQSLGLTEAAAEEIADRHRGVGCDQILIIEPSTNPEATAFMRIRNADGSEAEACGNGARCVAYLLLNESNAEQIVIDTLGGIIEARRAGELRVAVDMGEPHTDWRAIPLARDCDTLHVPLATGPLNDPVATSMGNPHATFFVPDVAAIDIVTLGPVLEHDPLFPARANIGIAQILSRSKIRLRVWERGDGLTQACGSGACATLVAAHRRGLTERRAEIVADGGILEIEWRNDNHVMMTGPVAISFSGTIDPSLLAPA
jgi:diaminopimelate epimerase